MASMSRRGFLSTTSLAATTIGMLGALPTLALADGPATGGAAWPATPSGSGLPSASARIGGAPFVVYISDPSRGSGAILIGEESIPFTNVALVQSLQQAIA